MNHRLTRNHNFHKNTQICILLGNIAYFYDNLWFLQLRFQPFRFFFSKPSTKTRTDSYKFKKLSNQTGLQFWAGFHLWHFFQYHVSEFLGYSLIVLSFANFDVKILLNFKFPFYFPDARTSNNGQKKSNLKFFSGSPGAN